MKKSSPLRTSLRHVLFHETGHWPLATRDEGRYKNRTGPERRKDPDPFGPKYTQGHQPFTKATCMADVQLQGLWPATKASVVCELQFMAVLCLLLAAPWRIGPGGSKHQCLDRCRMVQSHMS